MKRSEIAVGVVYEGKSSSTRPGEQRKVLAFRDNEVQFEVMANPNKSWGFGWGIGKTHWVFTTNFARWAQKVVSQA